MHAFRGSRPTLEAVAAHAGVSRATVSRVVNGGAGVREEVREKVMRSVHALGYVPNNAARTLVTRRTGAVAVVIAEPESRVFADPFFAQQLRGISRELARHDTQLLLMMLERPADYERIGRYLSGGHVDGALLFSLHGYDPPPGFAGGTPTPGHNAGGTPTPAHNAGGTPTPRHDTGDGIPATGEGGEAGSGAGGGTRATVFGLPVVFGGRPGWPGAADDPDLLYVDSDNRDGARQAVAHLLERGRRKVAAITGPLDQTSALDRLHGYLDALGLAPGTGDPALVADGGFTAEGGERAMARLLDASPDLDAVFAGNDLMASGALRTLRARGLRVPQDVAVVGYDDLEPAAWTDPPLTTVRQDVEGMGGIMARLLLRRLGAAPAPPGEEDRPAGPVITAAHLVVRGSS